MNMRVPFPFLDAVPNEALIRAPNTFAKNAYNWAAKAHFGHTIAPKPVSKAPVVTLSHEQFIQAVREAAAASPALTPEEAAKIRAVKLVYGIGEPGLRGVTYYGKWHNGCKDCPVIDLAEVTAHGEETPVQLAGTTVHELGHVLAGMGTGHSKAWKEACARLGLRHVMAAGTRYLLVNFQPRIREVIAAMGAPQDGKPLFRDGTLATGALGVCTMGIGTRGGKSRGVGSGSRMLKVVCPQGGCAGGTMPYVARVARSWLESPGAPLCPAHNVALVTP